MELIITKNGHVFARSRDLNPVDTDVFELKLEETLPQYPAEDAGRGKYWDLDYIDGVLSWVRKDRELTEDERMQELEERMYEAEFQPFIQPTGAHDAYKKGDKVKYKNKHYISMIDANVWSPDDYAAGWEEVL